MEGIHIIYEIEIKVCHQYSVVALIGNIHKVVSGYVHISRFLEAKQFLP